MRAPGRFFGFVARVPLGAMPGVARLGLGANEEEEYLVRECEHGANARRRTGSLRAEESDTVDLVETA